MKDTGIKAIPNDAIYKDVVVIGNGPSGISLSYMLSGHWPYWIPEKINSHPDELLRARLNFSSDKNSLVSQDLMTLADGLEGRSTNPVSLLLDSLQNPCADLGMELPSMLEYKYHPDKQIDHVVLGKGPPGGSWHRMDPNLRTLSLSAWMSLPGMDYTSWEAAYSSKSYEKTLPSIDETSVLTTTTTNQRTNKSKLSSTSCRKCTELRKKTLLAHDSTNMGNNNNESEAGALCCRCSKIQSQIDEKNRINDLLSSELAPQNASENGIKKNLTPTVLPRRNLSLMRQVSKEVQTRALVSRVAEYYENYVSIMDLKKYFICDTTVTAIVPMQWKDARYKNAKWIVYGTKSSGKPFSYITKNVVLANGASDLANRLGLRGENLGLTWIKHELPQLEVALENLAARERSKLKPVLVVGAGLSAADAVTICRSSGVPVIHVYRNKSAGLDKMLPENVYPEYHAVHKMMKDSSMTYDLYTPLAEHTIIDISTASNSPSGAHRVIVQHLITGETKQIDVSFCAILIGSRPDLRFLSNVGTQKRFESRRSGCLQSIKLIEDCGNDEQWSLISRKMTWLKNLCAKCKHLNVCEWSRRNEYKKICGHNYGRNCECNRLINQTQQQLPHQTTTEDVQFYRMPAEENVSIMKFGEDPTKPIDCKSNPIAVDKYTNAILNAPKGLYAMGPLVGDNFVRFIPGGALAITSALYKEND